MSLHILLAFLALNLGTWGLRSETDDGLSELAEEHSGLGTASAGVKTTAVENKSLAADNITVRRDYRVAGHTNLELKTTFRVRADEDGVCKDVLDKFKRLALEEVEKPGDDTDPASFLADVEDSEDGNLVEEEAEAMQTSATLRDAMEVGEVITMSDQNKMVECTTGEQSEMMEANKTASGETVLQGDMVAESEEKAKAMLLQIASGQRWAGYPWPDGKVYYCVEKSAPKRMKKALKKAITHIESQIPCIKFHQVGTKDDTWGKEECVARNAIYVTSAEKGQCYSYVGQTGGSQKLNVGRGCWSLGIVVHELCHALGMAHEQSRPDRDFYVNILWQNIKEGQEHNFEVSKGAYTGDSYDAYSLMHYAQYDFSIDRGTLRTIESANKKLNKIIGQRAGLSEMDVKLLGKIYKCERRIKPFQTNEEQAIALVGGGHRGGGRQGALVKLVFRRALKSTSWTGTLCKATLAGGREVETEVKWGSNPEWQRMVIMPYPKGTSIMVQCLSGMGFDVGKSFMVSSTHFYPRGMCNDGCSFDLGDDGMTLELCIATCTDARNCFGCHSDRPR